MAAGGGGQPGYPALAAGAWIWGGTLDAIQQTITHGIRSGDPDAREAQMPRFGADGMLKPAEIQQVADYVMTLFGHADAGKDVTAGQKLFAENCAICHGDAGQGDREKGAPRLASQVHLLWRRPGHGGGADHHAADGRDADLEYPAGPRDDQERSRCTCIRWAAANDDPIVMAGLDPAIHVFIRLTQGRRGWPAQGRP